MTVGHGFRRTRGQSRLLALLVSLVVTAFAAPPDPFTQVAYTVPLFVVSLPVAYHALDRAAAR